MNIKWKSCFRVGVSIFLLFLCIHYWDGFVVLLSQILSAISPVFVGLVIAYILNILMSFYERHYFKRSSEKKLVKKSRRPVCMILAMVTLVGIVTLIVSLVIPELMSCVKFLAAEIPPAMEELLSNEFVVDVMPATMVSELAKIDWQNSISTIVKVITSGLGSTVSTIYSAVSSVFSAIITFFIALIFSIYLLLDKENLQEQCKRLLRNYMRPKWVENFMYVFDVVNDSFHRYIVGQCTEAVILGLLCMIGMLILGLPYAVMIGSLIGFTALIPVAGAYIGAGVGAFMIFTISPVEALIFLIFILIIQQVEGNLIYPKVVGNSIGLPAIWVLATVTVSGSLMGISGMLIGVPIAASVYRLVREDVVRRESAAKIQEQAACEEKLTDTEPVKQPVKNNSPKSGAKKGGRQNRKTK